MKAYSLFSFVLVLPLFLAQHNLEITYDEGDMYSYRKKPERLPRPPAPSPTPRKHHLRYSHQKNNTKSSTRCWLYRDERLCGVANCHWSQDRCSLLH